MALRALELFAGAGGLALGLDLVGVKPICYVEREAYAAAVLAARMGEGELAEAPIWSDVRRFAGLPWRGKVDLVSGGFPCQSFSKAGEGKGIKASPWRDFARIINEVQPPLVFIENVSQLVKRGLDTVLFDLASLGYDACWTCVRAYEVGSPQTRERLFILAYTVREGLQKLRRAPRTRTKGQKWQLGPKPAIRRSAHGVANWVDRLYAIGNGVVPQQAAMAWEYLVHCALSQKSKKSTYSA